MSDSISTVDAARALRPKLPELIGDQANILGPQLDQLLDQADQGQSVSSAIRKLVKAYPDAYDWLIEYLSAGDAAGYNPFSDDMQRGIDFNPLAGNVGNILAGIYRCPQCGSFYLHRSEGSDIPPCDNHPEPVPRVLVDDE
ncbi:MAG: hypothetical protein AAFW95_05085 [Cyanobacteria bacterium J06638_6]